MSASGARRRTRSRRLARLAACALLGALGLLTGGGGSAAAAPGDLDTTFGRSGWVETRPGGSTARANDLAIQTDGKLVAVGNTSDPTGFGDPLQDFAIARYSADGVPDTSFGPVQQGRRGWTRLDASAHDFGHAVAIQADGKIVVAGSTRRVQGGRSRQVFGLLRLLPNGEIERGFGDGGIVRTAFPAGSAQIAWDVEVGGGGRIVVAGEARIVDQASEAQQGGNAAVLARYLPNGSLDQSFGSNGMVVTKRDFGTGAQALALLPNGKVVTAGSSNGSLAVRRYNANGSPDASFGSDGEVTRGSGALEALVVQPDGKLLAGGEDGDSNGVLLRLGPDGSSDPSFGSNGQAPVPPNKVFGRSRVIDLALQDDGRIVAAGLDLLRFEADGSHDRSFITREGWGKVFESAMAVVIQASGKIVTAGIPGTRPTGENSWVLARWLASGKRRPEVELSGKKVQRLGKTVRVKARCDGRCTLYATGRLVIGRRGGPAGKLRLQPGVGRITGGETATLKLGVRKSARKLAERALRRRKKVVTRIRVEASISEPHAATRFATRTVRLRR